MEQLDFYERTKQLCREKQITIENLMVSCDLTKDTFMKWRKRATFPKADDLYKMCKIFGVSMEYLLKGEDTVTPSRAQLVYNFLKDNRPGELTDILTELEKKNGISGIKVG